MIFISAIYRRQVDGFVDQLDRNGTTLKSYTYRGLFPTTLANIPLNYNDNDKIEEFDVTFAIQFFETLWFGNGP